jgi:hypothetical protein
LPAAAREGRDVLRRHHIAGDTFVAVMAAHAQHADDVTGRNSMATVEHIQLLARCSERTVQRARAAARELGVGTEIFRGRHLTLVERLDAHQAGRTFRGWASVYCLGCPRWLARKLPGRRPISVRDVDRNVDGGTPPCKGSIPRNRSLYRSRSSALRTDERAPRAASNAKKHPKITSSGRWHPQALELADQLQHLVRTFAGVHPGRLAPTLTRFALAKQPWTAKELRDAIERVQRTHNRTWISLPRHSPAYLAWLLRDISPEDNHDSTAEKLRDLQKAELREQQGENLCAHGVGGADLDTGRAMRCAFCRISTELH